MNFDLTFLDDAMWTRLALTLLHFVWQGCVIGGAFYLICRFCRVQRGAMRARLALGAMALMLACPVATYVILDRGSAPRIEISLNDAGAIGGAEISQMNAAVRRPERGESEPAEIAEYAHSQEVIKDHRAAGAPAGAQISDSSHMSAGGAAESAFPWTTLIVALWLLGVAASSLRLFAGSFGVLLMRRRASATVPIELRHRMIDLAARLHLRRPPRLRMSARIRTAMVSGVVRPMIILPLGVITNLPPTVVAAILAHELAHVRRGDHIAIILQRICETLLFYHPVVWCVSRTLSQEREIACDDLAARAIGEPLDYAEALERAATSGRRGDHPATATALAFAKRRGALLDRVRHLLNHPETRETRSAWPGVLIAGILIAAIIQLSIAAPPAQAANEREDGITVRVVEDETGDPIANAELFIDLSPWLEDPTAGTDDDGRFVIRDLPEHLFYVRITASVPGRVPMRAYWHTENEHTYPPTDSPPSEFEIRLPRGATIGGLVRNTEGEPIADATVRLWIYPSDEVPAEVSIRGVEVKTDEGGRWTFNGAPATLTSVSVGVSHPDYISSNDNSYSRFDDSTIPALHEFRDQSAVITLEPGVRVAGRVVDLEGRPIADAEVHVVSLPRSGSGVRARTDREGQFTFAATGRPIRLAVVHPEFAPDERTLTPTEGLEPLEFQLHPGGVIRGRVIDQSGEPIPHAWIAGGAWRDLRYVLSRWVQADDKGAFAWKHAPPDPVSFSVGQRGYITSRDIDLTPREREYEITLQRVLRVSGTVTDARSGGRIETFTVTPGFHSSRPGDPPWWSDQSAKEQDAGTYEIIFDEPRAGYYVKVDAPGHLSSQSRLIHASEERVEWNVELQPDARPAIAAIVLDPDGNPVEGADVLLAEGSYGGRFDNGRVSERQRLTRDHEFASTDARGRFEFPPSESDVWIVGVAHESGYGVGTQDSIERGEPIQLTPWATVRGVYLVGDKPAANESLSIDFYDNVSGRFLDNQPRIAFHPKAETDSQGRFVFERVPAGLASLRSSISQTQRFSGTAHSTAFEVEPGDDLEVMLGGRGRPVTGMLVAPEGTQESIVWGYGQAHITAKDKQFPHPDNWQELRDQNKAGEWIRNFQNSDEGRAFYRRSFMDPRWYSFHVNRDGSFCIENVLPGEYELEVEIADPEVDQIRNLGAAPIGRATGSFTVPPLPEGVEYLDEQLDAGEFEFEVYSRIALEQEAPPLEVTLLSGEPLSVADVRGKVVVLDFWATWCGPCVAQMPAFSEVHSEYANNDRVIFLGLSLDKTRDDLQKFLAKHEHGWPQAYLGPWSETEIPSRYGVYAIPSIIIIGPDGRIFAKDVRIGDLRKTIERALEEETRRGG